MNATNIKMHVKQELEYQQKHPQTNSKQVLLNDKSSLDTFLQQGTDFHLIDGRLAYKDPNTGLDKILSTSSLENRPIGNVSNLTLESLLNMANIKWEDPKDVTIATNGESMTITSWMGTKVVMKEGSIPEDMNDGSLLLDSKVRNKYTTNGFDIIGLETNKIYYIKLFPYTNKNVITNDNTNVVTVNTKSVPLDTITDISLTTVGGTTFVRFTDPDNKEGIYKGEVYPTSEYAGTKIIIKKDVIPSSHTDGILLSEYTTKNKYSTNATLFNAKFPSEGKWFLSIYNYSTRDVYSLSANHEMDITFLSLDDVTNLSVTSDQLDVTIKWQDPSNKTHFLETDHIVASWTGTKLVRKENNEPVDENDGVLLIDSKVRDQYKTSGFIDSGLEENKIYFYKLFPYTDEGKITNRSVNSKSVTPVLKNDFSGSPGPTKLLGGDTTAGYYGVVSPELLIKGSSLATQIGLSVGTAQYDTEGWLKFNLDGKVLFVAKKPFRYGVSWDSINSVNAVDGTKIISINGLFYKIRLIRGAENNPCENLDMDKDTIGSEWNRLMYPIHEQAGTGNWDNPKNVGTDVPNWGIGFTDVDLVTNAIGGYGSYSWCQENAKNFPTSRIFRGASGVSYIDWIGSAANSAQYGWRPVLEFIGPALEDTSGSPGATKTIARGYNEGYFGEVASSVLIKGSTLAAQMGLSAGTVQYDSEGWLKFIIDQKILFVAKKTFRNGPSWDQLNAAGVINGSKTIKIGNLTYKVRLMRGAENNPANDTDVDVDALGSEWNRLMLPIHIHAKTKGWSNSSTAGTAVFDWGIGFTDLDLITHFNHGSGSFSWCQESAKSASSYRIYRGYSGAASSTIYGSGYQNTNAGWRPVLELVQ